MSVSSTTTTARPSRSSEPVMNGAFLTTHQVAVLPTHLVALLLAHQGGWDEIALVLGPIIILGGLLMLANRRADRIASKRDEDA